MGEIGSGGTSGGAFHDVFLTYLLGQSLVGVRADDIAVAAMYLNSVAAKQSGPVEVVAVGSASIPALHAVALDPDRYAKLTLRGTTSSWLDVVRHPEMPGQLTNIVHGALLDYDLSDLRDSLPKEKLRVEEPLMP